MSAITSSCNWLSLNIVTTGGESSTFNKGPFGDEAVSEPDAAAADIFDLSEESAMSLEQDRHHIKWLERREQQPRDRCCGADYGMSYSTLVKTRNTALDSRVATYMSESKVLNVTHQIPKSTAVTTHRSIEPPT